MLSNVRFRYISRLWLPFAGGAELEGHHFVSRLIAQGADVEVVCFLPEDAIESKTLLTYPITRIVHPDLSYEKQSDDLPILLHLQRVTKACLHRETLYYLAL